jgi:hypothetical protein
MGGDVAVTETEPGRPDAVRRELLLDDEALVASTPPLLLVDAAAEGVHHGVQVGTDHQPEQGDVVAGVADHGDLGIRDLCAQAEQEAGRPDATGRNDDVHGTHHPVAAGARLDGWRRLEPAGVTYGSGGRLETRWQSTEAVGCGRCLGASPSWSG